MRSKFLMALGLSVIASLAGCSDDADTGDSTVVTAETLAVAETPAASDTVAEAPAASDTGADTDDDAATGPSHERVLACLTAAGLDAKDQSNSRGSTIGIDYPGGRLVVSFQESEEDAETYASVGKSFGETIQKGTVVISLPEDAQAEQDRSAIEDCVDAG